MTLSTYPLSEQADSLRASSGRPLADITLDAAAAGALQPDDLQISAEALLAQAEIARGAGFAQLAENLTRAAELTRVPNEALLAIYEQLRPHRATFDELMGLAQALETQHEASTTARFVREAAHVYRERGLLQRDF